MIGAVEQEFLQDFRIAGDEARAHARHVGALRQAAETHQPRIAGAAQPVRGLQAAERRLRFVEIDLGVALVGGDDEAVPVGQVEQLLPLLAAT